MTHEELMEAIDHTKDQIYQVKQEIEESTAPQEKHQLKRRLKELQYLQLRHLAQLG